MRDIRWSASVWKCLRTPRELWELITANCLDEVQQLELPSCHSKTPKTHTHTHGHNPSCTTMTPLVFTRTEMSSLFAPHPSFLWLPCSWQGQIYSSESSARWLSGCWSWYELACAHRLLRLLFSAVGFSPLLWYWWNPKDACSQMSQRQRERQAEKQRHLAAPHRGCNTLELSSGLQSLKSMLSDRQRSASIQK